MDTNSILILSGMIICVIAMIMTIILIKNQNPNTNETYQQSRKKTVLVLSVMYIIAAVIGIILVAWLI